MTASIHREDTMSTPSRAEYEHSTRRVWAEGGALFAGIMLATLGVFQVLEGIAAIAKDDVFVRGVNYVFEFDLTAWGWIQLILGVIAVATGVGLLMNKAWANMVGLVIAFLSALSSFAFLPYYPVWSIVILGFDIFIVWALSTELANQ
jgi:hypothetical protein